MFNSDSVSAMIWPICGKLSANFTMVLRRLWITGLRAIAASVMRPALRNTMSPTALRSVE